MEVVPEARLLIELISIALEVSWHPLLHAFQYHRNSHVTH